MATLGQVGNLVTRQLREQVEELVEAVEEEAPDFSEVSRLADGVAELADRIGAIYREVEQALAGEQRDDPGDSRRQEEDSNGRRTSRRTSCSSAPSGRASRAVRR